MPKAPVYMNYVRDPNRGYLINLGDTFQVPNGNVSAGWPPFFKIDTIFMHDPRTAKIYVSATNDVRIGAIYEVDEIFDALHRKELELQINSMAKSKVQLSVGNIPITPSPQVELDIPDPGSYGCEHEEAEGFLLTSTYKYCKKCGIDLP